MPKTALITGASSGIGLAFAHLFARNGYSLILVARSADALNALKQELTQKYNSQVVVLAFDLTQREVPQQIFEEIKKQQLTIDVLINNAGFGDYGEFANSDWDKLQSMILLNILALTHLTRLFLPDMVARSDGQILNVASTAAFQAGPMMAVYFATKAYVLSFSEAIAAETTDQGITVTVLCPGPTQSNFSSAANMGNMALANQMDESAMATATEVAQRGYEALNKKQVVAVHGRLNQLLVFSTRLMPRALLRKGIKQFLAPLQP